MWHLLNKPIRNLHIGILELLWSKQVNLSPKTLNQAISLALTKYLTDDTPYLIAYLFLHGANSIQKQDLLLAMEAAKKKEFSRLLDNLQALGLRYDLLPIPEDPMLRRTYLL